MYILLQIQKLFLLYMYRLYFSVTLKAGRVTNKNFGGLFVCFGERFSIQKQDPLVTACPFLLE